MCGYRAGLWAAALVVSSLSIAAAAPSVDLAKMPLAFEPNRGQGDRAAHYFARGAGYTIALQAGGAAINVGSKPVTLRFAGASANSHPVAQDLLAGKVNYFIGNDARAWHRDVPTYASIRYPGIYPGIDVVYYGQQGSLEFDFQVQPNADSSRIRLRVQGSERARIDASGDLILGAMRQHKPLAYQVDSTGARTPVDCRYELAQNQDAILKLGTYDHSRALVIDPVITYMTYLGGSANESVTSVKVDAGGNLYLAGFTSSANFPTRGAAQSAYAGTNSQLLQMQFGDAFVAKLNAAGTALIYATYLGGSGDDFVSALAIDPNGNAYVAGATQSANFPTTTGVVQNTYKGFTAADNNGFYNPGDGFVAKLNAAGNQLLYATYLGGALNDIALGIAVDTNGNAVVVGSTESSDFPVSANAQFKQFRGASDVGSTVAGDAFLTILNPTATALIYSTFFGGKGHDAARGVALDAQNNIYMCGLTSSSDFPVMTGGFQTTFQGAGTANNFGNATTHGFVAKFNLQGTQMFGTFLEGAAGDAAAAIAVDGSGATYVTGSTTSSNFPATANAPQKTYKGRGAAGTFGDIFFGDAFVTKLNPAGSDAVYSTYLGGAGDDTGTDIAVDAAGNAYVTGFTISSDFPKSSDALQPAFAGFGGQGLAPNSGQGFDTERVRNSGDAFFAKLSPTGALTYSSYFGGTQDDAGLAIAVDAGGNAYVAGNTLSTGLKPTAGALQASFGGMGAQFPRGDGFVVKFGFGGSLPGPAAQVTVVPGFNGSGAPGAALTTPFTVEVSDSTGTKLAGVAVAFSATGATVNPVAATTDSSGRASTTVTLGATAGTGKVTATVAGVTPATADLTIGTAVAAPVVTALVNGASFLTSVSPGSWITVFIDQIAKSLVTATTVPLPTILANTRILVNNVAIPMYAVAPLASGTQLNAQLPYETAAGPATAVVEVNGVQSKPFTFTVQQVAPGIFVFGNNRAVVQNVNPDGSLTVNTDTTPVPAGDFIIAYLTGQGPLDNPVPTGGVALGSPLSRATLTYSSKIGTTTVPIAFLGMTPSQIALAQANIQIPRDTPPGTYSLTITIGSGTSNGPNITVTNPRP